MRAFLAGGTAQELATLPSVSGRDNARGWERAFNAAARRILYTSRSASARRTGSTPRHGAATYAPLGANGATSPSTSTSGGSSTGGGSRSGNARRWLLVVLGLTLLGAGAWLHARRSGGGGTDGRGGDRAIVLALIADAHLIGPQYVCCTESNDVDNDSIMKTVERLHAAQRQIEALQPPPAGVVFLGDVIHNGYYSHEYEWYLRERNAYTVGGEIFRNFTLPVHYLWGNHDYKTVCGSAGDSYERAELSHALFRHFLGDSAVPYSAVQAGRYTILLLNALLGPSWDPNHPLCDTRQASLGAQQLSWLQEQLRSGRPTFIFVHYPLPTAMRNEAPELPQPDLLTTLLEHRDAIMAVFSGHYHRGLDWKDAYPFPHLTLPAVRYDDDNFFLLHLPQTGPERSWRVLDWAKNKGGARCSDTWAYPPGQDPAPSSPAPPEQGSCGRPSVAEVAARSVHLDPLQRPDDVPGPKGHQFNPETPCTLDYQYQFLKRCLDALQLGRRRG